MSDQNIPGYKPETEYQPEKAKPKVDSMFKDIDLSPIMYLLENEDISGWYKNADGGGNLRFFQNCFAEYCGTKHAYGVSSGSAAIYVALKACGIGKGDKVIVPAYTHIGTVAPVILAGAEPIFADVNAIGNINIYDVDDSDLKEADALIAVHMVGTPCSMEAIRKYYSGFIIEDASHALGTKYNNKKAGNLGDVGCFSIGGGRTKTIGTGEGGMITVSDDKLAEKIRNIRNHGDRYSDVDYFCFNFRMSELNALVGLLQMQKIEKLVEWQRKNAKYIIRNLPNILEPLQRSWVFEVLEPSYYMINCICRNNAIRDIFLQKLKEKQWDGGVPRMNISGGWTKLICDIEYYRKYRKKALPISEMLMERTVWIDWHRYPRTQQEIDTMLQNLNTVMYEMTAKAI